MGALLVGGVAGCNLVLPETTHQPLVHNPFPQLSRVAVLPFFNQSEEPTVDGREFALAYYAEVQGTPGYEVVPVGVAEKMAVDLKIDLSRPEERRRLGQALGVDAIVLGTVTDYSPYYPPRCGLRVDWYAANAGFHEIPAGYGLPWGTPQEEYIPSTLVFEAEHALARAQLATQSPVTPDGMPAEPAPLPEGLQPNGGKSATRATLDAPIAEGDSISPDAVTTAPDGAHGAASAIGPLPAGWPDARGFTPPGPVAQRPQAESFDGAVMTHTRVFRSTDTDFTSALAGYVGFRDDARFGGWESYLDRSEDFIRFCCHLHLVEMLSARGGADESRVVNRWSSNR
ncbi:MAG: hypothetical protein ACRCT8_13280 [Lacipirellulaceae bacterium]